MGLETRIVGNEQFLTDLFAGPFRGRAIIMDPELPPKPGPEDYTCSSKPLDEWVSWAVRGYELHCQSLEALDDDAVLFVSAVTGTQVFAAAFGCPAHAYEDSNPCALPLVTTLRGLNHVFQSPGPRPAIEAFSGHTVLMVAWTEEEAIVDMLRMALPETRFLFNLRAQPLDEAKRAYERLRALRPCSSPLPRG